jgi:GNAT superfamily N-acetyltransferase
MSIERKRRQVRALLYENSPADASAAYYAFHHPDDRTELYTMTDSTGHPQGYLCLSRTGMDLFRPLVTLRLATAPTGEKVDPNLASTLIYSAIPSGTALILTAPIAYHPIISALFDIKSEQQLRIMEMDSARFEPIINLLVSESESYNGLPRFVARSSAGSGSADSLEIAASAGQNWQSPRFAEIYVHTKPAFRRRGFGRSVVAAIVQKTLANGQTPLYAVGAENSASIQLAESVGFIDSGFIDVLYEVTLKPRPA